MRRWTIPIHTLLLLAALCGDAFGGASVAQQARVRPSMVDSFRLGTGGDTLCQAQRSAADQAAAGLFDRAYNLVCRDAAAPVGRLYALRDDGDRAASRIATTRTGLTDCHDEPEATLKDVGRVSVRRCAAPGGVFYDVLTATHRGTLYDAEGLSGYRSALELGLRTLVADRVVDGPITIALTNAGDAASFARVQAGSLDPALAMAEGYRRNNSGNYAEASQFFATLLQRTATGPTGPATATDRGEYLVNRALQLSDLGSFDEAETLFAEAALALPSDPVSLRQQRNDRALDLLNRGDRAAALAMLDAPLAIRAVPAVAGEIDRDTANALNGRLPLATQLGIGRDTGLTPSERASVLDAQADALRGSILRRQGTPAAASAALDQAAATLDGIREGRVASVARLRAQVMTERAALAENAGRVAAAERLLRDARATVAEEYPDSIAFDAASARLAGFLSRHGKVDEAIALYRDVVTSLGAAGGASGGFADLLEPYFRLLVQRLPARSPLGDDLFAAAQVLLRPGVADTQATLARELSGGGGEASRLFRQSLNETRRVNVLQLELARLEALAAPTAADREGIAADRAQLAQLQGEQVATQAQLARFPAYRAIATQPLSLADLRTVLRPDESYWKLSVVGPSIYALLVTPGTMRAWKVPLTPDELGGRVDAIRASVALAQGDATVTRPFDAMAARALYVALAGPAAADLPRAGHLIIEPDGAMLRLPVTLLIAEQAGVDRYRARAAAPGGDPYDLTGIAWLGRDDDVSVALSARAFRDLRRTPASQAPRTYLGFGQNAPVPPFLQLTSYMPPATLVDCRWPLGSWSHPVAATELFTAQRVVGAGNGQVLTEAKFTDTDIIGRDDLAKYRIVHFATHGLLVAPRSECPAQPALLTSFGGAGSDGLLSFAEIYRLHLDADLVILSACDTAGSADVAATRAAGVDTGGGSALDGLVRAFIGAGARSVLASHWPAPDSFGATEQLVAGLFTAPRGTPAATALRLSQRRLMDAPATSHPYYWAGFALIGDGRQPVLQPR